METEIIVRLGQANPGNWFGPFFTSVAASQLFLGILCSQIWTYYSTFPKDPVWLKRLVGIAFCLLAAKAIHSLYIVWETYLVHFGNWEQAVQMSWAICIQPIFTIILSSSAQVFFVWRCYALTGWNRYFLAALVTISLTALVASVGVSLQLRDNLFDRSKIEKWAMPMISMTILLDSIITGTVSYKLLSSRRGDNRNTDMVLSKLFAVIWESALPPTIVQIIGLAVYFTAHGSSPNWSFLINELTSSLYVFSLLYTLNSRLEIRKFSLEVHTVDYTERAEPNSMELSEVRFRRTQGDLSTFSTFDRRSQAFRPDST